MCFTHFTVIQNGWTIGGFTAKEMAVSTAKQHAVDTGKPVTVVAHVAGGAPGKPSSTRTAPTIRFGTSTRAGRWSRPSGRSTSIAAAGNTAASTGGR